MKKIFPLAVLLAILMICAPSALAWDNSGSIGGTDIEFSDMTVSKTGLDVRLKNVSAFDVKVSLRVAFIDREGNTIGYSIVGLREIPAGTYADISRNFLNGNWRQCRDARRMIWEKMTYEQIY